MPTSSAWHTQFKLAPAALARAGQPLPIKLLPPLPLLQLLPLPPLQLLPLLQLLYLPHSASTRRRLFSSFEPLSVYMTST